jgi:two-component system LytT family response regulator/two-component system response regulator LytT
MSQYAKHKSIRAVLVDDEPPALDELAYLLSEFPEVDIVTTASTGQEAVKVILEEQPDLVFLDIQMPGKNGFEVLSEIILMHRPPLLIFATAYDQYAIQAFEENAVDYLLKPISLKRLHKSMERVKTQLTGQPALQDELGHAPSEPPQELRALLAVAGIGPDIVRISVECDGRNVLLNPREIIFFQFAEKRVHAHTRETAYTCPSDLSLEKIEERLQGFPFFRANRSQLINLAFVRSYAPWFNGKYVATLNDEHSTDITINKARVKAFRAAIEL